MELKTTFPSWAEQKQAELIDMEWDWRHLDEIAGWAEADEVPPQIVLAKKSKEAEAARLRAELAVASFIEEFYVAQRFEQGEALIATADLTSWRGDIPSREHFGRFVSEEAHYVALPSTSIHWGPPLSSGDPATDEWWIDLSGVAFEQGQDESWRRYRFHVVANRVDAWMTVADLDRM